MTKKRKISLVLVFFLALAYMSYILFFTYIPNKTPKTKSYTHIPLHFYNDAYHVMANFEGVSCALILDTGSASTPMKLPRETIESLINKTPIKNRQSCDVNGNLYKETIYMIKEVCLAPIKIKNIACGQLNEQFLLYGSRIKKKKALPRKESLKHIHDKSGLLGAEFFSSNDYWLLDLPNKSLYMIHNLEDFQKEMSLNLDSFCKISIEPLHPEIVIQIDTEFGPKRFIIDTGATDTIMRPPDDHFQNFQRITLKKFAANGKNIPMKNILIYSFTEKMKNFDGFLGRNVLDHTKLLIDNKNNYVYLQVNE